LGLPEHLSGAHTLPVLLPAAAGLLTTAPKYKYHN